MNYPRAACYLMLEDPANALEDTKQATILDPQLTKGWSRLAKSSILLGNKVMARMAGNKLKNMGESEGDEVLENIDKLDHNEKTGDTAVTVGKYSDGAYWYGLCVNIAPHYMQVRVGLALCLVYLDRFEEAMVEVNKVMKNDDKNVEAVYVRGLCFYYQDITDKALEHFKTVLKLDPDHEPARETMKQARKIMNLKESGNKNFKSGNFEEALEHYSLALKVDSLHRRLNSKLYFNRATVHARLDNLQSCLADCSLALENDPNYLKPLLRRAKTYMGLQDYENAVNDYEKAYACDPGNLDTKQLLKEAKLAKKKMNRKDYYKILCIDVNAKEEDIKKAYRTQAMKHHPDKHISSSESDKKYHEKMFKEVSEAFNILSDKKQKEIYDNGDDFNEDGWDVDEDGNIDSEAIWQQLFGNEKNTFYSYL